MIKKALIIPLIAGTIILTGCNKADRDLTSPSGPTVEATSLELDLKNYNESLVDDETISSRGINWAKVKNAIKVGIADAMAGVASYALTWAFTDWLGLSPIDQQYTSAAGAGLGGGFGSRAAAGTSPGSTGPNYDPAFNVDYPAPAGFSHADIGSIHNDVLDQVLLGTQSQEDYLSSNYNAVVVSTLAEPTYTNILSPLESMGHNYYLSNHDPSVLFAEVTTNQLAPANLTNIMSLLADALLLANTEAEIETTLAFYSNSIVSSTQLSGSEKASLIAGISTARSSINYWYHLGN